MGPRTFLETVCRVNVRALFIDDDDFRLAVNAILSLDAFMGSLYIELRHLGLATETSDHAFRNRNAAEDFHYRMLRDAAFSIKHGELNGQTRLVSKSDQIASQVITLGDFHVGDGLGNAAVYVEQNDGAIVRAAFLAQDVLRYCEEKLALAGL